MFFLPFAGSLCLGCLVVKVYFSPLSMLMASIPFLDSTFSTQLISTLPTSSLHLAVESLFCQSLSDILGYLHWCGYYLVVRDEVSLGSSYSTIFPRRLFLSFFKHLAAFIFLTIKVLLSWYQCFLSSGLPEHYCSADSFYINPRYYFQVAENLKTTKHFREFLCLEALSSWKVGAFKSPFSTSAYILGQILQTATNREHQDLWVRVSIRQRGVLLRFRWRNWHPSCPPIFSDFLSSILSWIITDLTMTFNPESSIWPLKMLWGRNNSNFAFQISS